MANRVIVLFLLAVFFACLLPFIAAEEEGELSAYVLKVQFILYVVDQAESTSFYTKVLGQEPSLNVPGMTQFEMPGGSTLGVMPTAGIKKLLGEKLPNPEKAAGVPRAELYLRVSDPEKSLERAVNAGAEELSTVQERGWGDRAGYCLDLDGHVLAFAGP